MADREGAACSEETSWWNPPPLELYEGSCPQGGHYSPTPVRGKRLGPPCPREGLPHPPGGSPFSGAEGEVAATQKTGQHLPQGGPWGPTGCHCESWWFLLFLSLLRKGPARHGWGVAASSQELHAGSHRQLPVPQDFLGCCVSLVGVCWGGPSASPGPSRQEVSSAPTLTQEPRGVVTSLGHQGCEHQSWLLTWVCTSPRSSCWACHSHPGRWQGPPSPGKTIPVRAAIS